LDALHPGFAIETTHSLNIVLMVGFALLVPIRVRIGVSLLACVAATYPVIQLLLGHATLWDPLFASQVVDLSAGLGISSLVLIVHNRLLHGRSAALNDLARLAEHDALTSVKNRRTFMDRLVAETNRCERYALPMGVLMYDIDGFKRFNTEYGYAAGDEMLKAVALAIDGVMHFPQYAPMGGVVARYGGEEFVALLPSATAELVRRFADESRAAVAARRVHFNGHTLKVTVSVGYLDVPGGQALRSGAIVDAADKALYRAKATGGNRCLPSRGASLTADLADPRFHSAPAGAVSAKGRAEALLEDNRLLHAVVLRWSLGVAALWILFIGLMDVALVMSGHSSLSLKLSLGIRGTLAAVLGSVAWLRPRVVWSHIRPTILHALFITGLSAFVVGEMQHSGGLTSPYFSQLIYIVLAWALAFSVQRWISVVVLVAVCAMVPIWFVGVVGEPLMHIDVVIRMVALSAAGGVAYSTQRVFSNTRAAEISARHELEQLARIDPLTGLPNRAAFEERATALVARARSDSPLTLVMLDLDHFKQLNDTYGHLLGDEALAKVAMVITETVRTADVPARLGGEEFVVLLPMTDVEGATLTAERLRRAIKAIPLRDGSVLLAASLGVSSWRKGDTGASLLERADSALRRAKAQGRDRTEVEQ
jgi:diguanylate cyclase (GGDEF)-like protein